MDGFNIAQTIPLSSVIFRQTKKHLAMTSAAIKCGLIKVVTVLRLSCVLQLKSVEKNIVTVTSFFLVFSCLFATFWGGGLIWERIYLLQKLSMPC